MFDGSEIICDMFLIRTGGISTKTVEGLLLKNTFSCLLERKSLELKIEEKRSNIIDRIYNEIGNEENQLSKEKLINFKRQVYNHKENKLKSNQLQEIKNVLRDEKIKNWINHLIYYEALESKMKRIYEEEFQEIGVNILELFNDNQDFLRGIHNSNFNSLQSLLKRKEKVLTLNNSLSRTAYNFIQRAALKTSPFSTLTEVGVGYFSENKLKIDIKQKKYQVKLNRGIITDIYEAISFKYPQLFTFRIAPIVRINNNSFFLRKSNLFKGSFFWNTLLRIENRMFIPIIDQLKFLKKLEKVNLSELLKVMKENYVIDVMMDNKIIIPNIPFEVKNGMEVSAIKDYLLSNEINDSTTENLSHILNNMKKLKHAQSYKTYQEEYSHLENNVKSLYQSLNANLPYWSKKNNLIYEDVSSKFSGMKLDLKIKTELESIIPVIKENLKIKKEYFEVIDYFKHKNSKRIKLLDFISEYDKESDSFQLKDYQGSSSVSDKYKKGVMVYFQIIADDYQSYKRGDYQIVINKVAEGNGAVFARFNQLFEREYFGDIIENWISIEKSNVYELPISSDWSNLQENFEVLQNSAHIDNDIYHFKDNDIELSNIYVRLNKEEDYFQFETSDGLEVNLEYLGTTPKYLMQGILGKLMLMISPLELDNDMGINPKPWVKPEIGESIIFHPRQLIGNVIVNRRKWIVPKQSVPENNSDDLTYFNLLYNYFRKHELPFESYMSTIHKNGKLSKPVWFNLLNPLSVNHLKHTLLSNQIDGIVFYEALPSHQQNFLTDKENNTYVSEFVIMGR